eukprot:TRINITY_DN4167_c0_g2_i2.p1 TRINITY_DN4167_c0_g2~~TRINITY_DN4167_c0_g2_i2.p1  ORF type:complete len:2515 (-),score=752.47 TRINITY_DN4167_c0_g2_i2:96-7640(-)
MAFGSGGSLESQTWPSAGWPAKGAARTGSARTDALRAENPAARVCPIQKVAKDRPPATLSEWVASRTERPDQPDTPSTCTDGRASSLVEWAVRRRASSEIGSPWSVSEIESTRLSSTQQRSLPSFNGSPDEARFADSRGAASRTQVWQLLYDQARGFADGLSQRAFIAAASKAVPWLEEREAAALWVGCMVADVVALEGLAAHFDDPDAQLAAAIFRDSSEYAIGLSCDGFLSSIRRAAARLCRKEARGLWVGCHCHTRRSFVSETEFCTMVLALKDMRRAGLAGALMNLTQFCSLGEAIDGGALNIEICEDDDGESSSLLSPSLRSASPASTSRLPILEDSSEDEEARRSEAELEELRRARETIRGIFGAIDRAMDAPKQNTYLEDDEDSTIATPQAEVEDDEDEVPAEVWRRLRPEWCHIFEQACSHASGIHTLDARRFRYAISRVHPHLCEAQQKALWRRHADRSYSGVMTLPAFCRLATVVEVGDHAAACWAGLPLSAFAALRGSSSREAAARGGQKTGVPGVFLSDFVGESDSEEEDKPLQAAEAEPVEGHASADADADSQCTSSEEEAEGDFQDVDLESMASTKDQALGLDYGLSWKVTESTLPPDGVLADDTDEEEMVEGAHETRMAIARKRGRRCGVTKDDVPAECRGQEEGLVASSKAASADLAHEESMDVAPVLALDSRRVAHRLTDEPLADLAQLTTAAPALERPMPPQLTVLAPVVAKDALVARGGAAHAGAGTMPEQTSAFGDFDDFFVRHHKKLNQPPVHEEEEGEEEGQRQEDIERPEMACKNQPEREDRPRPAELREQQQQQQKKPEEDAKASASAASCSSPKDQGGAASQATKEVKQPQRLPVHYIEAHGEELPTQPAAAAAVGGGKPPARSAEEKAAASPKEETSSGSPSLKAAAVSPSEVAEASAKEEEEDLQALSARLAESINQAQTGVYKLLCSAPEDAEAMLQGKEEAVRHTLPVVKAPSLKDKFRKNILGGLKSGQLEKLVVEADNLEEQPEEEKAAEAEGKSFEEDDRRSVAETEVAASLRSPSCLSDSGREEEDFQDDVDESEAVKPSAAEEDYQSWLTSWPQTRDAQTKAPRDSVLLRMFEHMDATDADPKQLFSPMQQYQEQVDDDEPPEIDPEWLDALEAKYHEWQGEKQEVLWKSSGGRADPLAFGEQCRSSEAMFLELRAAQQQRVELPFSPDELADCSLERTLDPFGPGREPSPERWACDGGLAQFGSDDCAALPSGYYRSAADGAGVDSDDELRSSLPEPLAARASSSQGAEAPLVSSPRQASRAAVATGGRRSRSPSLDDTNQSSDSGGGSTTLRPPEAGRGRQGGSRSVERRMRDWEASLTFEEEEPNRATIRKRYDQRLREKVNSRGGHKAPGEGVLPWTLREYELRKSPRTMRKLQQAAGIEFHFAKLSFNQMHNEAEDFIEEFTETLESIGVGRDVLNASQMTLHSGRANIDEATPHAVIRVRSQTCHVKSLMRAARSHRVEAWGCRARAQLVSSYSEATDATLKKLMMQADMIVHDGELSLAELDAFLHRTNGNGEHVRFAQWLTEDHERRFHYYDLDRDEALCPIELQEALKDFRSEAQSDVMDNVAVSLPAKDRLVAEVMAAAEHVCQETGAVSLREFRACLDAIALGSSRDEERLQELLQWLTTDRAHQDKRSEVGNDGMGSEQDGDDVMLTPSDIRHLLAVFLESRAGYLTMMKFRRADALELAVVAGILDGRLGALQGAWVSDTAAQSKDSFAVLELRAAPGPERDLSRLLLSLCVGHLDSRQRRGLAVRVSWHTSILWNSRAAKQDGAWLRAAAARSLKEAQLDLQETTVMHKTWTEAMPEAAARWTAAGAGFEGLPMAFDACQGALASLFGFKDVEGGAATLRSLEATLEQCALRWSPSSSTEVADLDQMLLVRKVSAREQAAAGAGALKLRSMAKATMGLASKSKKTAAGAAAAVVAGAASSQKQPKIPTMSDPKEQRFAGLEALRQVIVAVLTATAREQDSVLRKLDLQAEEGVLEMGWAFTGAPDRETGRLRVVVDQVRPGSWAWDNDIEAGDELVLLDGAAAQSYSREALRNLLGKRPLKLGFVAASPQQAGKDPERLLQQVSAACWANASLRRRLQDCAGEDAAEMEPLPAPTVAEMNEVRRAFKFLDATRSGDVGVAELTEAMTMLDLDPVFEDVYAMLHAASGCSTMDFTDFLQVVAPGPRPRSRSASPSPPPAARTSPAKDNGERVANKKAAPKAESKPSAAEVAQASQLSGLAESATVTVRIGLLAAFALPIMDTGFEGDRKSQLVLHLRVGDQRFATRPIASKLDPVWPEGTEIEFKVTVEALASEQKTSKLLELELMDIMDGISDSLGVATLDLSSVPGGDVYLLKRPLQDKFAPQKQLLDIADFLDSKQALDVELVEAAGGAAALPPRLEFEVCVKPTKPTSPTLEPELEELEIKAAEAIPEELSFDVLGLVASRRRLPLSTGHSRRPSIASSGRRLSDAMQEMAAVLAAASDTERE